MDRHLHPDALAQFRPPAIGGVDHAVGRDAFPRFEPHRRDPLSGDLKIDGAVLQVADAEADRLAAC